MKNKTTSEDLNTPAPGAAGEYRKPKLRRIKLAAEEVLTTGCKMAGTCDLPFDPIFNPNPTGAGS